MTADQVIRTEDERDALPPGTVLRAVDIDGQAEWWMAYIGVGGGTYWVGITVDPEWGHDTEHKSRYMTLPAVVVSTPRDGWQDVTPRDNPLEAPWDDLEPREPKHRKPSPPPCCEPTEVIDGTWLVEQHDHHTCGAGPGSGAGHEPGCGLVPLVDLRGLPGWDALIATARRDALNDARAAQEEGR